ncbi:MAG: radical SAM protein [Magnetococcales bacterium]|nr:radical SAM protein [Magnetococcales bacterium]
MSDKKVSLAPAGSVQEPCGTHMGDRKVLPVESGASPSAAVPDGDPLHLDGHKLLWHPARVRDWQRQRVIAPLYLEISPVSYCNHRCLFCGVDFQMEKGVRLPEELLCRRLQEMGELGVKAIMFAGEGEPTLHPSLGRFIETGRGAGIDISLTTNGNLGDASFWERILPHLTWVRFSVDAGSPEVYARVHGVAAGMFQRTLANIIRAVALKREGRSRATVGVQILILEENIDDIARALALFSEIGVDYIALKPYSFHPQQLHTKEVHYTAEVIGRLEAILAEFSPRPGTRIVFRKAATLVYAAKGLDFHHCRALPFWGYINAQGEFYTCSVFLGDKRFLAGSIHDQEMKGLFFGPLRSASIAFGERELVIGDECRVNCRMARINEYLEELDHLPLHRNFV